MNSNQTNTPDQLLESFRGRSFKSIIFFTLIVHVVVIGGSSVPYFIKTIAGKSDSKLTEEERSDLATKEATAVLREIATKHGIKPQDLSNRLAGGKATKAPSADETSTPKVEEEATTPESTQPEETEQPKSAIEKQLEVKEDGPTVPPIPVEEAADDDLFK